MRTSHRAKSLLLLLRPLSKDYAHGRFVQDREFERTPGLTTDCIQVGMKHFGAFGLNLREELVNRIGFERNLGSILGSIFCILDYVGFCAVTRYYCKVLVTMEDLKSKTVDEEIESLVQFVVEDFRNEPLDHSDIQP